MKYWRMNLHPTDEKLQMKCVTESLAAGFIGLGFDVGADPGDLDKINPDDPRVSPQANKTYWSIQKIEQNDFVAIFAHNEPIALVKVIEEYNYIKKSLPELGIWFNHFRRIERDKINYFADLDSYKQKELITLYGDNITKMTIQGHQDPEKEIYQFIEKWTSWY